MSSTDHHQIELLQVRQWITQYYGLQGTLKTLVGYDDANFKFTTDDGEDFLVKLSSARQSRELLEAQNKILKHLQNKKHAGCFPQVLSTLNGELIQLLELGDSSYYLRLLSFLSGQFLHEVKLSSEVIQSLGVLLASMDSDLKELELPCLESKRSPWDLQHSLEAAQYVGHIEEPQYRRLAGYFLQEFHYQVLPQYPVLPRSVIHGDANDHNILVNDGRCSGIIDFGDACHSYRIHELAIALTYTMMSSPDPITTAQELTEAYHKVLPLTEAEIDLLYPLVNTRLAVSLIMSSYTSSRNPDNQYLRQHQTPVKSLMQFMLGTNPLKFSQKMHAACGRSRTQGASTNDLVEHRHRHISKALSISYHTPLHIVKGALQYLYDSHGQAYLDGVNNISHVGHCHPRVVEAASRQLTILNTNTRYLYRSLNRYAERICRLLPDPLEVVFFVNSGSEANDLALRMARNYTGHRDFVVFDAAYHGNSSATLEISPYKYQGKGGAGPPPHTHQIPLPDPYRGALGADITLYNEVLAKKLLEIESNQGSLAGFIAESLAGCGGQIVYPAGLLEAIYHKVRAIGGLCIADEVQVGFGRVGQNFWGFETQEVIPDIVTMGKPMGNGHPLAAVVTTREIARAFENGMEYFNSFGGNPVSCEIGMAVLDIIEEEGLQDQAYRLGKQLQSGLEELQKQYEVIGDVRGLGLFQGVELVRDRQTKEPAGAVAEASVEKMRTKGVLLSTDGPDHNVIKIKPPMVINSSNIDRMIDSLDEVLKNLANV